jgi:hypothetical protein
MDSTALASLAGVVVSLLFEYTPKLKDWYNALDNTTQRLFMLGVLLGVALVVFGASCANFSLGFSVDCSQAGAVGLLKVFVAALVANQATYVISPKADDK